MPPIPKWLDQLSGVDAALALTRFRVEYVALMYCQTGSLRDLSVALGKSPTLLYNSITKWPRIPAHYCVALEQLVGREVVTREWLNPDIFNIAG